MNKPLFIMVFFGIAGCFFVSILAHEAVHIFQHPKNATSLCIDLGGNDFLGRVHIDNELSQEEKNKDEFWAYVMFATILTATYLLMFLCTREINKNEPERDTELSEEKTEGNNKGNER